MKLVGEGSLRKSFLALILAFVLVGIVAFPVSSQPIQFGHTWGSEDFEMALAIDVDRSGNVYIVGGSQRAYTYELKAFVAKFDPLGVLLWDRYLVTPGLSFAMDVKVDSAGDAYVLGLWNETGGPYSSLLVKMSSTGDLLYAKSLPAIAYGGRLALDPSTGGPLVIGQRPTYGDGTVMALDPNGAVRWARGTTSGYGIQIAGVAADASGNAYVLLGRDYQSISLTNFDGRGGLVRQRILRTTSAIYPTDLALAADGSLYALGSTYEDGFVIKLDSSLAPAWQEFVGSPTFIERPTRLALLPDGTFYALGQAYTNYNWTMYTMSNHVSAGGAILKSSMIPASVPNGNSAFYFTDAAALSNGGVVMAGASLGLPERDGQAVPDATVRSITDVWGDDSLAWEVLNTTTSDVRVTTSLPNVQVDNFGLSMSAQAWWGVMDTPAPPLDVRVAFEPPAPLSRIVNFTSTVSNGTSPYTYRWSFGDGTFDTIPNPSHGYVEAGRFLAQLVVQDSVGNVGYDSAEVLIMGPPEILLIDYYPRPAVARQDTYFYVFAMDPDGGPIVQYAWDFGDGSTFLSTDGYTSHRYMSEGNYTLTLTVTDDEGSTATNATVIEVVPRVDQPPYACFNYWPYQPTINSTVTFDAGCSWDPDGYITSYAWDFGDGTAGNGSYVNHVYTAYGNYTITLTVTDDGGMTASTTSVIAVVPNQPPVASFWFSPTVTRPNETVYFNGWGSYDPDGWIVSWAWDFGDGSTGGGNRTRTVAAYGPEAWHAYATSGDYVVTLTVMDNAGATGTSSARIHVNEPPVAVFAASRATGKVGTPLIFDGSPSYDPDGRITSYFWSFGDGGVAEGPVPSHVFAMPGSYLVSLTVYDEWNATGTTWMSISILEPKPPVAIIAYSPARPGVSTVVTFNGSYSVDPDGSIATYIWQFGDGSVAYGAQATHKYGTPGTYEVKLTVIDEDGLIAQDRTSLAVVSSSRGVVVASSLQPVAGARVTFSEGGTVVAEAITAADGSFELESLAPGTYEVEVTREGFATKRSTLEWTGDVADLGTWSLEPMYVRPESVVPASAVIVGALAGGVSLVGYAIYSFRRRRHLGALSPKGRT